jgi:hypothetical protein
MKLPQLLDSGPQVTDADLDTAERGFGIRIPPKYRRLLLHYNGGRPEVGWFVIPGHADGWDLLDVLLGIGHPNPVLDMGRHVRDMPSYVEAGLLPIGTTASASLLCIDSNSLDGERVGYIDIAEPLDRRGLKQVYHVADDIQCFLRQLSG